LGGEFDMAVVVGEQIDSNLAQKRLFAGGLIWISSPGYALRNNLGERLHDHASHLKICETRYAGRQLEVHQAGKAVRLVVPPTVARINDPLSVREAVIAGFGVSLLPLRYCRDQLRSGELVEVWQSTTIDAEASKLSVIFPGRRLLAPRCRAVLNFLEDICRTAAAE
jgi:DNA-binding transcriptional LysR family regulator